MAKVRYPRLRDYPRRLMIDGELWRVELTPEVVWNGEILAGLTDDRNQRVIVCSKLKPRRRLEIFVHELLHAVDNVYDLGLSGTEMGHNLIYDLEAPIVDLLVDNWPWVFAALRGDKPKKRKTA